MIITFDLGNTNLSIGVFKDDKLIAVCRTSSDRDRSVDEYSVIIESLLLSKKVKFDEVEGTILSSVVNELTKTIYNAIKQILPAPIVLGPGIKTGLMLKCDNPIEVGADIVAGCVAVVNKYGAPAILIDLGTATKVIAIDKTKAFAGCAIIPGVKSSAKILTNSASLLPSISLDKPEKYIGKNTQDCMNSGVIYGNALMIDGFIRKFEQELDCKCQRILIGGLSKTISPAMEEEHILDSHLLHEGLRQIYLKNKGDK